MPDRYRKTSRADLQALWGEVVAAGLRGGRCGACGAIRRMVPLVGGGGYCADCHAGCPHARCADAAAEDRAPAEQALWRAGVHAQAGESGAIDRYLSLLEAYEDATAGDDLL